MSTPIEVGDRVRLKSDADFSTLGTVAYLFTTTPKASVNWDMGAVENWLLDDLEVVTDTDAELD